MSKYGWLFVFTLYILVATVIVDAMALDASGSIIFNYTKPDDLGDWLGYIGQFVGLFFSIITFQVEGMPWFVNIIFFYPVSVIWFIMLVSIIRGVE